VGIVQVLHFQRVDALWNVVELDLSGKETEVILTMLDEEVKVLTIHLTRLHESLKKALVDLFGDLRILLEVAHVLEH
jgi:hypothetical protein